MRKRWITTASDRPAAEAVRDAAAWGVPLPLARLLRLRGFDSPSAVDRFLRPRLSALDDPLRLPDMPAAVERIERAIVANERLVVFGDYDVDGITATALLTRCLRALGADVHPFLPHRVEDGYGLRPETTRRCISELRPRLIVTVDCGVNAAEAVAAARAEGVEVVVTDHHLPGASPRPDACAIVNPKLASTPEPWRDLAGVGVAFKLCHALLKAGRNRRRAEAHGVDLRRWLDLVALGTIADAVPLTGENRILARHGLDILNRKPSPGLRALLEVATARGEIGSYQIGFVIGPRLNAAGRLDTAEKAFALLDAESIEEARPLAESLDAANRERQKIEARALEEAEQWVAAHFDPQRDFGIVVAGHGWHPGIIGLIASRLALRHRRPVVAISIADNGAARGSSRSIEGFHLVEALDTCADLLDSYGGHAQAAGLTLPADSIDAFRQRFLAYAGQELAGADLRPPLRIDQWIPLADADESLLEAVRQMRPFGQDNPAPVWAARRVQAMRRVPVGAQGRHLRLTLADGGVQREAIGFHLGARPMPECPLDIAFELQYNEFNGRRILQLLLLDFRPSEPDPPQKKQPEPI
jgi:single-stranded-DNA-specific exonuclease